jgi:hypothetical protein
VTIETHLQKRPALYKGEVGLFPSDPANSEDFALIDYGLVMAKLSTPKNTKLLAYIHVLAKKVADALGLGDIDDGKRYLKHKARFVKFDINPDTGEVTLISKSMRKLSNEALKRLADRMVYIVVTDVIPDLDEGELRRELEGMVDIDRAPASGDHPNAPGRD